MAKRHIALTLGTTLTLAMGLLSASVGAAPRPSGGGYTFVNLGALPGYESSGAYGANDPGDVVGICQTGSGPTRAFFWSEGAMSSLGDFVVNGVVAEHTSAGAINNHRQVVGAAGPYADPDGFTHDVAFLWDPANGFRDLNDLNQDGVSDHPEWKVLMTAGSINDSGQICGSGAYVYPNGTLRERAFLLSPGNTPFDPADDTIIPMALSDDATSRGFQVNATGQCIGYNNDATVGDRGFLYNNGVLTNLQVPNVNGINSLLETVGFFFPASSFGHAYYRSSPAAAPVDLGTLGGVISRANRINGSSMVVGESDIKGPPIKHAFRWRPGGKMEDLNNLLPRNLGWTLFGAHALTENGKIAGIATNGTVNRAYLLIPR